MASKLTIVNKSDHDTKAVKRLVTIVMRTMKKTFVFPPLESIRFESYDSHKWDSEYDGRRSIVIRIGRKIKFPCTWDRLVELPTWEDLFVGLLCWCICLHYQRTDHRRKTYDTTPVKYRRTDCQEITLRLIKKWRVDDAYKMILEKANVCES